MRTEDLERVFRILRDETKRLNPPLAEKENRTSPFMVLVGVLLSSRTKDDTTGPAVDRLFEQASTPEKIASLPEKRIEELIFPVGFYHTKARHLKKTARMLVSEFNGDVPQTIQELLSLPGIGRKSANLILAVAFGIPAICVDTHVHRITNRLGYVKTKDPYQTETALREKLPKRYWIEINRLLVIYGQNVCTPLSPYCAKCKIETYCDKVGVTRIR
ncbi:endonuclease III [candidate division TA06 bacterium B3_TA06]|uniref:Endonuclease III n=1 Tax=candidate division TA06 bacterium B3_TA06 TaxID=2012487 RepID=A0A532V642_UNCT6|nr:MAG: endonuclease III [candidate division TA06 bacterium B3_TA06]